jgi:CBS domain-containing protein
MSTAQHILDAKDPQVVSVAPDATVLEAARLMNEHRIGALVVLANGMLAGIFTERDIMRRIVAEQRDPAATKVGQVMTSPVACATPHTLVDELREVFREKRIRHLPVVDAGKVHGIVSIGDVNRVEQKVREQTIQYLQQYISVP